jgi:MFS family permease
VRWCRLSAVPAVAAVGAGRPRAARVAVFVQFVAHGAVAALWVSHVALVKGRLGLDARDLGLALLALSAGSLVAMQGIGPLVRAVGTRAATRIGVLVLCGGGVLPSYARSLPTLALALAVLGGGIGMLDVSMNAQAAEVETRYPRPVMAAFHAAWSLTGMVTAVLCSLAIRSDWPMSRTTLLGASLVGAAALIASRWLLPPTTGDVPGADREALGPEFGPEFGAVEVGAVEVGAVVGPVRRRWAARRRLPRITWLLGALCFGSFLCEGAAADWAGVHLREDLGATAGLAALGYGAFSGAMTAGRLVVDRVAGAVGGVPVLRYGGLLAVVGTLAVIAAPDPAVALAGWAVTGIGLAGVVPQLFSAAANLPGAPATLARVTSLGYLGTLAGPGIIGLVAQVTSLRAAFVLLTVLAGLVAVGAGAGLRSRD